MSDQENGQLEQYRERIDLIVSQIRPQMKSIPDLLIILGSGLGSLADQVENAVTIPYSEIKGFPETTVPGHVGRLVIGEWSGKQVAVMQGRFHYYEGHPITDTVLPIRVMQKIGVPGLILTNAAGGINVDMKPGNLMLIRDHISFWAESPLRGPNLDEFGPRFPDQTRVYDREMAKLAIQCAQEIDMPLYEGIYAYCQGPQFETPAEIRLLRSLGATAAGMSTVPEAIVAAHGGMRTLAISCITNLAAGILDQPLNHKEVLEVGAQAESGTIRLLSRIISQLPDLKTRSI